MTAVAKVLLQLMTVVVNSLGRGVAITLRVFSFCFPFVFLLLLSLTLSSPRRVIASDRLPQCRQLLEPPFC